VIKVDHAKKSPPGGPLMEFGWILVVFVDKCLVVQIIKEPELN
jgi:hypothetical protein